MHRAISLMLILSLVATVAVPVWASQPAPVKHTASFGVSQAADDGWWKDSKGMKVVRLGCTALASAAFVGALFKKAVCGAHPALTGACGACLFVAIVDRVKEWWD